MSSSSSSSSNWTGQLLHWKICQNYNLPYAEKWSENKPPSVLEGKGISLVCDFIIRTDCTRKVNR